MNKLLVLIITSLISFSSLAATEISKDEAKKLTKVDTVSHTDETMSSAMQKISDDADKKGAEYFVITGANSVGQGDSMVVISDLYTMKK